MRCLFLFALAFLLAGLNAQELPLVSAPPSVPYFWQNVQMVGGGFVDGMVFHPKVKGVRYCRTDMGGAYRWNDKTKRWEPMLDWVSYADNNLMGVESIALDPSDPEAVYLACGTYTSGSAPNGAILRSHDGGRTFLRADVPFKMGGNENGRGNGERMAVDPKNGNIIYLGTRQAGLWRSEDRGVTWQKVTAFPDVSEASGAVAAGQRGSFGSRGSGIVFVVFDGAAGKTQGRTSAIYVGVSLMSRDNMFRSADGGVSWQPIPGQPTQYRPNHAVLSSDGMLFVSYGSHPGPDRMTDGGVWRWNTKTGTWTDITPDKPDAANNKAFGYAAVAVDARNPKVVIASSFYRPGSLGGEEIFRSLDAGATWRPVFATGKTFDYSLAPYVAHTGIHWLFDIEIDPFDSDHALFTTGYGGHETFNLTQTDAGKPVAWSIMSTGIEETVALDLLSPPKGAALITAIGDYCGFVHFNLDRPVPEGCFTNPHFSNTQSLACAWKKPEVIVRTGINTRAQGKSIGYSLDGGTTWQEPVSVPLATSRLGWVAVSSQGTSWVWTPERSPSFVTFDQGATWTQVTGLPDNMKVVADREETSVFYALDLFQGMLYTSHDGGKTFENKPYALQNLVYVSQNQGPAFVPQTVPFANGLPVRRGNRGDSRGGQDRLYATPGYAGDLWIAAFDGLYHSTDKGLTFVRQNGVQEIHGFGFGKEAPGSKYPALYLIGTINGVRGIFQSDDIAQSWVRINDDQHQWGLLLHITGDPKIYGRVYVGTHGRGTVYGDRITFQESRPLLQKLQSRPE